MGTCLRRVLVCPLFQFTWGECAHKREDDAIGGGAFRRLRSDNGESRTNEALIVGEKLFEHLIESGIEIIAHVVFAMVDLPFDTVDFFMPDLGQGADQFE